MRTSPAIHRISDLALAPSRVGLSFRGIPGTTYLLERSENLRDWTIVNEALAPANGQINLNDAGPLSGNAFYRVRSP